MSRNYVFAPGEYYHIYARGFEKLPVFREEADYKRFLQGLYLFNSEKGIRVRDLKRLSKKGQISSNVFELHRGETLTDIGAYCLMPNHFHILVREKDAEGKGVSKFMQKLMTSYTMYFNKKNSRTGRIFGSAFKARHVTDDNHLKYLFSYIHINPRSVVGTKDLVRYAYSSYADYCAIERKQGSVIQKDVFPDYFEGAHENEIKEWLTLGEDVSAQV